MYSQEVADAICTKLAEGLSLRAACKAIKGPDPSTVLRWKESNAEFAQQYTRARETGYQLIADQIIDISDDSEGDVTQTEDGVTVVNTERVARSKLRVDSRKWLLSKMLPKVYGDKIDLNHTGSVKFEKIEAVVVDPKG